MWVYQQVQTLYARVCAHVCTFTPLLLLLVCVCTMWVSVCMRLNCIYECVGAFCPRYPCMCVYTLSVLYEATAWAGVSGWMVSFGIYLFYYVCVCQTHCASTAHTKKKKNKKKQQPLPGCCWAQCLKTAQIMQDTAEWEQELFCLTFFFYKFMDICTNHTKINIVSIGL